MMKAEKKSLKAQEEKKNICKEKNRQKDTLRKVQLIERS